MGIEGSPIIGSDVFGLFCQRLSQHIIGKERDSLSLELEQKQRPQTTETHTYSRPCLLINFAESNFPCRGRKNKKKKKGSPIYPGSFCVAADSFFFRETPKCKCISSSFFLIQLLFAISENVMGQVCFQLLLVYHICCICADTQSQGIDVFLLTRSTFDFLCLPIFFCATQNKSEN